MTTITPQSVQLPSTTQKPVVQIAGGAPAEALPSTAAMTSATQQFYKPRARANSGGQRRTRTESLTSPTGLPLPLPGSASVSRSPSFTKPPPAAGVTSPAHSLTHTGNILPPAAFYRPARPNSSFPRTEHGQAQAITVQPSLSSAPKVSPTRVITTRPSSAVSAASSLGVPLVPSTSIHAREHGLMMLQPLSHIHTRGSDDGSASGNDSTPETKKHIHTRSATSPTTRVKPSREQLLPIREKEHAGSSQGKVSPALNGVRESLERMFRRTTSSERDRERSYLDEPDRLPVTVQDGRQMQAAPASAASLQHASIAHRHTDSSNYHATTSTTLRAPTHHTYITPRPPARTVPVQQKSYGPERNWQIFRSQNTFFLRGRFLTGGDSPWAFLFSLSLVFGIAGVWFGTTCVWWWQEESPAVAAVGIYMCLLTFTSMFATALRDPGILPRDLDPDPPYEANSPSDGGPRAPLPRDLRVRSGAVRVKYCATCLTYRPPRSSHCKLCDNCVEGCDHHCPWVNNCVGRRNYTSFFTFLLAANLTLLLVIITSAIHIWLLLHHKFVPDFRSALKSAPGSAAAFCISVVVIGPVAALFFYHVRLMLLNITTIEQVRNQAHRSIIPGPLPPNAFTLGKWYRNLAYLMCRPVTYSWIEADAYVMHDQRLPNPGYGRSWKDEDLDISNAHRPTARESGTWQDIQHY